MSLAQHVVTLEGFDRDPNANTPLQQPFASHDLLAVPSGLSGLDDDCDDLDKPTWRRLSFDAFIAPAETALPAANITHTAAYKVSDTVRILQVATAVVLCCISSGIMFGFAAIKPILLVEGVYSELCEADTVAISHEDDTLVPIPCPEQDLRLNLFFVAGSVATNAACLVAGAVLDRFGRRLCYVLSAFLLLIGCLLMGSAFAIPEFDGYLVASIMISLGGTFIFIPSFQVANAFPKHSGLIVALITGGFDASAAVFLFYKVAWDASGRTFSPHQFFFGYAAIVPILILASEFAWMPNAAYHSTPELEHKIEKAHDRRRDVHSSDEDLSDASEVQHRRSSRASQRLAKLDQMEQLVGDAEAREERVKIQDERHQASGIWGVLHGLPAHRQMMTPWFALLLVCTIVQMMRMNFFIATIRSQYQYILGNDMEADLINTFFDVALPLGGIASTPFIGALLNRFSVGTTWIIMSGFILVVGVFNCLSSMWTAYMAVLVFVIFRPLYYAALSDYTTKVFGFTTFGRVYGTIACISGLMQLLQSGLDALVHGPLENNPIPINVTFTVVGTATAVLMALYIHVKGNRYREEQAEAGLADECMGLLSVPEAEEDMEYGTMV
jgi:MFS family permease